MLKKVSDTLYPPPGAASEKYFRAGLLNLVMACVVFVLFGIYMFAIRNQGADMPPPYGFVGLILWMIGVHYLLWRGVRSDVALINVGKVIVTAIAGFASVMIVGGSVGAIAGMIVRSVS